MEWIKLIGVVIIVVGFIFKLDTIATVIIAGLATALVSGIDFMEFLRLLGEAFTQQRIVSIFYLTLPMIGLSETFGLKQRAVQLINRMKGLTFSRFLSLYLIIRELAGLFSIRLGGHPQFVRPLVYPMAEAAAKVETGKTQLSDESLERIKGLSAANENFGNFYAQNTFLGASGVLLIAGTLNELGYEYDSGAIAVASLPIAVVTLIVVVAYNYWSERQIKRHESKINNEGGPTK